MKVDAELLLVVACLAACGAAWESFESRPGDMMSLYNSYPAKNRAKYPYFYMGKPVPRYSEQSHSKPVYPSHDPISSSYSKSYQHEYNHLPTAPHKYSKYPERPPHRYYQPEPQYPKQSGYVYHFISIPPSPYYKSPSPSYQKTIPRPPLHQQPYQNIPPLSESSQQLPTPTVPTKPPTVATTTDKPTTIGTIQPDILVTPATLFTPVMDFIPIADDQNAVVEGEAPIDDDADDIAADEVDIFGQVDLPDEKAEDTTEVPNSAEETTSTTEGISGNETELEKPLLNAVAEEEVAILPSPVTTQLPIPSLIVTEVSPVVSPVAVDESITDPSIVQDEPPSAVAVDDTFVNTNVTAAPFLNDEVTTSVQVVVVTTSLPPLAANGTASNYTSSQHLAAIKPEQFERGNKTENFSADEPFGDSKDAASPLLSAVEGKQNGKEQQVEKSAK